ncbi:MAG TPA: ATP-binding cassette domain-containing protein [Symbiobacteriaceae bacterium]|nr:ATP-binding cassette domain-containing protein [Symbiobacteriaceae bacterium]
MITVENLQMTYQVPVKEEGLGAALRSLFRREFRKVEAVRGVSFELEPGEVVGFIGPNGAGKTTTLKILSGVLHPTGGTAAVLGRTPWQREPAYLRQIAMIRGSRPLGAPTELTVLDALRFQQLIYEVPAEQFRQNLSQLTEMLHLEPLLPRQVRALSLGERMRAGLAWSLIYRPRVLFLDEPTLGLDVTATAAMRRFVAAYSRESGATVLLTSHYMADVETLCRRVILIDRGALTYDGDLAALAAQMAPFKLLKVAVGEGCVPRWDEYGEVVEQEGDRVSLRVRREAVPATTGRLLAELPVADLSVAEPPLESVIDQVYRTGGVAS